MSGGHFNYGCFRISQFADELEHEIEINDDETKDEFGDKRGYGFEKETISRLMNAQKIIETAGKLAREIEWLYSGDHGEESFNLLVDNILKQSEMYGPHEGKPCIGHGCAYCDEEEAGVMHDLECR